MQQALGDYLVFQPFKHHYSRAGNWLEGGGGGGGGGGGEWGGGGGI
jgi:hypothetical protein